MIRLYSKVDYIEIFGEEIRRPIRKKLSALKDTNSLEVRVIYGNCQLSQMMMGLEALNVVLRLLKGALLTGLTFGNLTEAFE